MPLLNIKVQKIFDACKEKERKAQRSYLELYGKVKSEDINKKQNNKMQNFHNKKYFTY